jgi:hypothetical protein
MPNWDMNVGMVLTATFAAVMNYTEMEAKVREATNNEPYVRRQVGAGIGN